MVIFGACVVTGVILYFGAVRRVLANAGII